MMSSIKNSNNFDDGKIQKVAVVGLLYVLSILIMVSGAGFALFSLLTKISFMVMNASVHGSVFGIVVFYLGVRYFLSIKKLKTEVYKQSSVFSWKNFSKESKAHS